MATPNSYFIPGYGISRAVIQNEIRYHCGPDAIVRPYTFQVRINLTPCGRYQALTVYQGRDGFLVSTVGPPLTKVSGTWICYAQITDR